MIPIVYTWVGDSMVPLPRFAKRCDDIFVIGMTYTLVPHQDRSMRTHNHFFACVQSAWQTLPEDMAERFPTSEHLRKWALIKAGYHDERNLVCENPDEALRVAAFIRPADEYAVVTVRDDVVTMYTAKSQSMKAMSKTEFGKSKTAVLDILADLLGVDTDTLAKVQAT